MITIQATGDTTLRTAGKYCEEDILVKVPSSGGGVSLPQLSNEGGPEDLVEGKELINSSGNIVIGTNPYEKVATDSEVQYQADLLSQAIEALKEKAAPEENLEEELSTQELLISTQDSKIKELAEILSNKKASNGTSTVRISVDEPSDLDDEYLDDIDCMFINENLKSSIVTFYGGNTGFDKSEISFKVPNNSTVLTHHSLNFYIDNITSNVNQDFYDLNLYNEFQMFPVLSGTYKDEGLSGASAIPIFGDTEIHFAKRQEV